MSFKQENNYKFKSSVLYEYMTKAQIISRPYTAADFKKEYFIPNPDELGKQR